jgi:hypothetical protein
MQWCRRRDKFNEVPEKVPKVPKKVWEVLVQSQVTFKMVPKKVLVQSQVKFNRVPKKVPKKISIGFGAKPSQR